MGKIAFVFAGQGAQQPGMGKSFYEGSSAARKIFDAAEAIRPGTLEQCFSGTEEELKQTRVTQPCLFTVALAAAAALEEAGVHADMAAGFSLGELAALTYAGVFSFEEGLKLVTLRGELMQKAAEETESSMAAVLKLTDAEVEALCARFSRVYPVNYNCPGQVSVSGAADEMAKFCEAVKASGGKAVPIRVNGAFHSPFMDAPAASFAEALGKANINAPKIPVYANFTGKAYSPEVLPELSAQMNHPVRWEKSVRGMIEAGADKFLELGAGKTLCGLIKRIDSAPLCVALQELSELEAAVSEVKPC